MFGVAKALTGGASQVVTAVRGRYKGITVRETAGAALTLRLWDNPSAASGSLVHVVTVPASGSVTVHFADLGIVFENGLYVERVAGTTYEGSVFLG